MIENFQKKNNSLNKKIIAKQLIFVTSSGIMMITCTLIGYFIGNKYNSKMRFLGTILGSAVGLILFVIDIIFFINMENKNNIKKNNNNK